MWTFQTDFQAELVLDGRLSETDQSFVRRAAFPQTPPYAPAEHHPDWRSYKIVPFPDGMRLLISVVSDRGRTDRLDRPVLSATGLVATRAELTGPLRDIGSVWRALDHHQTPQPPAPDALLQATRSGSPLWTPTRFATLVEQLADRGTFLAEAAAALSSRPGTDVVLPADSRARRALQPVLLLVPLARLMTLHLATGSVPSERREPILATPLPLRTPPPESFGSEGVLRRLFQRKWARSTTPAKLRNRIDFEQQQVSGGGSPPSWLVQLATAPSDWPEISAMERLRFVLEWGDNQSIRPNETTLSDAVPAFAELRRATTELRAVEASLRSWT